MIILNIKQYIFFRVLYMLIKVMCSCSNQYNTFELTPLLITQLPEGIIVSKEARSAIARAASVYVLYSATWLALLLCNNVVCCVAI